MEHVAFIHGCKENIGPWPRPEHVQTEFLRPPLFAEEFDAEAGASIPYLHYYTRRIGKPVFIIICPLVRKPHSLPFWLRHLYAESCLFPSKTLVPSGDTRLPLSSRTTANL